MSHACLHIKVQQSAPDLSPRSSLVGAVNFLILSTSCLEIWLTSYPVNQQIITTSYLQPPHPPYSKCLLGFQLHKQLVWPSALVLMRIYTTLARQNVQKNRLRLLTPKPSTLAPPAESTVQMFKCGISFFQDKKMKKTGIMSYMQNIDTSIPKLYETLPYQLWQLFSPELLHKELF
jgi:hypothetical protein